MLKVVFAHDFEIYFNRSTLGTSAGMYTQNIERGKLQKIFVWKGKIEFKHSSILCKDFEAGI